MDFSENLTSLIARVWKFTLFIIPISAFGFVPSAKTAPASSDSAYVPVYPLKVGGDGRHLVDQNNVPFMILGDSPQALIANLSESQAAAYFADRKSMGFNTVWINLLCNSSTGGNPDGTTFDGIAPFTNPGDLSTPNETYFQRANDMIKLAAQYNLTVILDPIETGGWLTTLEANGATNAFNYGVYVGNRYKTFPNIVWMHGNDFQNWATASDDTLVMAVANGIRSVDPNHIHTVELSYNVSSSLDDNTWAPVVSLNAAYTYYPTYAEVLHAYNQSSGVPTFMVEANYEFENNTGMDYGNPATLRRQEYWTQLSGATGQLYGNHYTWQFASGWQNYLDTTGAAQFGYMKDLFASRSWYNLVPDQNHTVVTAGYGTFTTSGSLGSNDYLTSARSPDGSLVMAYMPNFRTVTVDMSELSGPVTAQWFDPTNNTYVPISSSAIPNSGLKQFTPPGANSAGDSDWVLVLETASSLNPSPNPGSASVAFVQINAATPQTKQSTVTTIYNSPQMAGDANIIAVGWNDNTSNITSVSDSAGNAYNVAVPTARGTGLSQAIYYAKNIKAAAAGTNAVTVTFDNAAPYADVRILEYSGLDQGDPFDVGTSNSGGSGWADSGSAFTTFPKELIIGAGMTLGAFSGPGPGFSSRIITSPDCDIVEDETTAAIGNPHALAPVSNVWVMQVAAFKASTQ
jgi:hypothetical protein